VRKSMDAASRAEPIDGLENDLQNDAYLKLKVSTDLGAAKAENTAGPHIAALEKEQDELTARIAAKSSTLAQRKSRRSSLEADQRSAQLAYDMANDRLSEMLASFQFRGGRLRVTDPGIIPQTPSSPNLPLNVLAALLLSTAASFIYLVVAFGYARLARKEIERVYSLDR
jgi:uncharacterized protein involved in exopolysaccharide biosynthesis